MPKGSDLIREHLDNPRYADMPSQTLAKILVVKYPGSWGSLDNCRSGIREIRGQHGSKKRTYPAATHKRKAGSQSDGQDSFPKPVWKEMKHHTLQGKRLLVISDCHIPYHEKNAMEVAFTDAKAFGVDSVVILGDWWDFHQAQDSFDRERGAASVPNEIEVGREGLAYLRHRFKRCELTFLRGNHDMRLDRFIFRRAEQLWGIPGLNFESLTGIRDYGFELVEENAKIFAGKLILLHGHEICKSRNIVNAARGLLLQAGENAMIGHFHQSSQQPFTTLSDKLIRCWSLGCLCYLHPRYHVYNPRWNHGYALIELDKDGGFSVQNKAIYKGKAW